MQPANLTLVVGDCLVSAFTGGFIGSFAEIFMGSISEALISLLGCLGAAYAVGLWIGNRKMRFKNENSSLGVGFTYWYQ